jgi:hypothetical protein
VVKSFDGVTGGQKLRWSNGLWKVKHVKQYVRRINKFLELLLFAVHQTSGQRGRGTGTARERYRDSAGEVQ